jgi:hypothetical protein
MRKITKCKKFHLEFVHVQLIMVQGSFDVIFWTVNFNLFDWPSEGASEETCGPESMSSYISCLGDVRLQSLKIAHKLK